VRDGSASTAADNAPGAIINFITKDGSVEGGSARIVRGIDFDRTRLDFDSGAYLGDDWKFHAGGFFHYGEGVKKSGLTRKFADGFIRLDVKFLDDRTPVYLPVPVAYNRTGTTATYSSIPGFSTSSRGRSSHPRCRRCCRSTTTATGSPTAPRTATAP
jgi:hypothetical protein